MFAGACSSGSSSSQIQDFLGALPASVPDDGSPDRRVVEYGDLNQAARIAGAELPDDLSDTDALRKYYTVISGSPAATQTPTGAHMLGWPPVEIEQFAWVGPGVEVWEGDFDEAVLTETFGEPEDGVWEILGEPSVGQTEEFRGMRAWVSFLDDSLLVTYSTDPSLTTRPVDDSQGTLADDATLVSLANALDEHDAYSAQLEVGAASRDDWSDRDERQLCEDTEKLSNEPLGTATGIAHDNGRPVFLVVLTHEDDTAARNNAEALERIVEHSQPLEAVRDPDPTDPANPDGYVLEPGTPFRENFVIEDIEVDGTVVIARLGPRDDIDPAASSWRWLSVGSPLVQMWHC